jgi:hypothetical protein
MAYRGSGSLSVFRPTVVIDFYPLPKCTLAVLAKPEDMGEIYFHHIYTYFNLASYGSKAYQMQTVIYPAGQKST